MRQLINPEAHSEDILSELSSLQESLKSAYAQLEWSLGPEHEFTKRISQFMTDVSFAKAQLETESNNNG